MLHGGAHKVDASAFGTPCPHDVHPREARLVPCIAEGEGGKTTSKTTGVDKKGLGKKEGTSTVTKATKGGRGRGCAQGAATGASDNTRESWLGSLGRGGAEASPADSASEKEQAFW